MVEKVKELVRSQSVTAQGSRGAFTAKRPMTHLRHFGGNAKKKSQGGWEMAKWRKVVGHESSRRCNCKVDGGWSGGGTEVHLQPRVSGVWSLSFE